MKTVALKLVRGHRGDYTLGLIVFILLAFGLIMMYNISPALSQKAGEKARATFAINSYICF